MTAKADITPELLRQLIALDELTGKMTWKPRDAGFFPSAAAAAAWNRQWAGRPVGLSKSGGDYLKIGVLQHNFMAHRVVFAIHNNRWPDGDIDHINRDKRDNSVANLREATCTENNYNMGLTKANSSGYKGVSWKKSKGKWQSIISHNGKRIFLGEFADIQDAAQAYADASVKYHKEFRYQA